MRKEQGNDRTRTNDLIHFSERLGALHLSPNEVKRLFNYNYKLIRSIHEHPIFLIEMLFLKITL